MKIEGFLFTFVAGFLFVVSAVYWFMSHDPTGTTALILAGGLAFIVAYYVLFTARRIEPRPEDMQDAEMADGAGELGFFSPYSYWPIGIAASFASFGLGIIYGIWLMILAAAFLIFAVVGLLFEYYVSQPPSGA